MRVELNAASAFSFLRASSLPEELVARAWDLIADRTVVDGFVNLFAAWTYSLGVSLHAIQTGRIRQYVMFIVIGAVGIFMLIAFFWSPTLAR